MEGLFLADKTRAPAAQGGGGREIGESKIWQEKGTLAHANRTTGKSALSYAWFLQALGYPNMKGTT
jgi:hypothetical protein